ncbi:MAG: right-handed parallel beta-helix repeat-containing protein, partial [Clostridia bacterium]|nr:right-handed parallel beta-helix repeat-containing protein [Clostridia bacterium]
MNCINIVPGDENRLLCSVADESTERIVLEKGIYRFSEPLKIGGRVKKLEISGNGSVFTCRRLIKPDWKYYGDGIFFSEIKIGLSPDALYANGEKQILARYPNFAEGELFGGFSPDVLERSSKWANPAGGHLIGLHFAEWGSNDYIIEGKDDNGELVLKWVGDNNRGSEIHPVKRMVENIFEELDSPREWYYDAENRVLYYYPENGCSIDGIEFEVSADSRIIDIDGCRSGVVIENICFESTARTLFTGIYERPLRGDWGFVRDAAVRCCDTENITIRNCGFRDIGGNAVIFSGRNENCAVEGCSFDGIGATGVLVSGKTSCVRNPSFWDGGSHKTEIVDYNPGPQSDDYPRKIRINNCSFRDIGTVEKQTAAVCISISSHIEVSNCTVSRCSRAGININDGSFGGHIIRDNDLFDCVRETADHGPINCWGRDRYWSLGGFDTMGLNGALKRPFALLDAVETTVIRHNRVTASHAFGIDIDDGASNYVICDNLCVGAGIKLRDGFDRRVYNNIVIGAAIEQHMIFAH